MYYTNIIVERIKSRAKQKSITVKLLLEQSGMNRNVIAHLSGGSMLKADNLAKIADALDCSTDYLLGRTDNPEVNR